MVFFEIIFPIILILLIGYSADRLIPALDLKTLSRLTMFILSPALIFTSLLKTSITAADAGSMFLFTLGLSGGIYLIAFCAGRILHMSPTDQRGLYLATIFFNAGNYGIPVAMFALGSAGMEREVLMLVFQNVLISTIGVYIAASNQMTWKSALKKIFQIPPFYAVALAFLCRGLHIEIAPAILKPLELLSQGSVPLLLLTLGIQLSRTRLDRHTDFIATASVIRLVVSPLLAVGLVYLLGIHGITAKTVILAAATPTSVNATLYALEFETASAKVSGVTLVTTVLSILTITGLLWGWLLK